MKISIVVPVFNEELRIKGVLESLSGEFEGILKQIIVINDCSTDNTDEILRVLLRDVPLLKVHRNLRNAGHGPSVVKGLNLALGGGATHVLTYDGDGFLDQSVMRKGIDALLVNEKDFIVEMVRVGRSDPYYRKVVTASLRVLVFVLTTKRAKDPNTPSRLIPMNKLHEFLEVTQELNPVPNLWFSIFARKKRFQIMQVEVEVTNEPELEMRNSWNTKRKLIPSRRFVLFCFRAIRFWTWKKY